MGLGRAGRDPATGCDTTGQASVEGRNGTVGHRARSELVKRAGAAAGAPPALLDSAQRTDTAGSRQVEPQLEALHLWSRKRGATSPANGAYLKAGRRA